MWIEISVCFSWRARQLVNGRVMSGYGTNIARAEKTVILAVQQLGKSFASNGLEEAEGLVGGIESA